MPGASGLHVDWRGIMIGAGLVIGVAACASDPAPEAELARDKLDRARDAMEDGENLEARRLAEQALVDAQLAEAQARSEVARQNAAELRASIETLRDELARQAPRTS